MKSKKIYIAGHKGMVGSAVWRALEARGYKNVLGCSKQDLDLRNQHQVNHFFQKEQPEIVIDAAALVGGIMANKNNPYPFIMDNLQIQMNLMDAAHQNKVEKFIFLGSQAEYGNINGIINEEQKCEAISAYGSVKLACLELLRTFSDSHKMTWIWLRLFSLFGEKENNNWLIPSIVEKIKKENHMNLTLGEQKYAYLYVKDFASIMNKIVMLPVLSGIYNISSDKVISIRSLVEEIRNKLKPEFKLNFGAVDYRKDQSMHMQGSINKLISQIGEIEFTNFSIALENTIKYYNK